MISNTQSSDGLEYLFLEDQTKQLAYPILPAHIMLKVFSYLALHQVHFTLAQTARCWNWKYISQEECLWKEAIAAHFPFLSKEKPNCKKINDKQYYQYLYRKMQDRIVKRTDAKWIPDALPEFFTIEKLSALYLTTNTTMNGAYFKPCSFPFFLAKFGNGISLSISAIDSYDLKSKDIKIRLMPNLSIEVFRPSNQLKYEGHYFPEDLFKPQVPNFNEFKQILAGTHSRYKLLNNK